MMPYWRLYYHLVWSTRYRAPVLLGANIEEVRKVVWGVAKDLDIKIHALSVQPDHVHIAFSAAPSHSIAQIAQRFKGGSSYQLGRLDDSDWVGWQSEYGGVGYGQQSLSRVVAYVNNQEAHHRNASLWNEFEKGMDSLLSPSGTSSD
jgi:putative transposase